MSNLITGDFPVKTYRNINMSVTGAVIKSSKGQIFSMQISNTSASFKFVKLYDQATAPVSTDTPMRTIPIPPNTTLDHGVGQGIEFLTGIGIRATTLVADTDNTAPATNDVVVNFGWL